MVRIILCSRLGGHTHHFVGCSQGSCKSTLPPPGVSDPSRDFYSCSAALSGLNFHMSSSVRGASPDLLRLIIRACSFTAGDSSWLRMGWLVTRVDHSHWLGPQEHLWLTQASFISSCFLLLSSSGLMLSALLSNTRAVTEFSSPLQIQRTCHLLNKVSLSAGHPLEKSNVPFWRAKRYLERFMRPQKLLDIPVSLEGNTEVPSSTSSEPLLPS